LAGVQPSERQLVGAGVGREQAALTSAAKWWRDQPDIAVTGDSFSRIGRRKLPEDRTRALDRVAVEQLLTSQRIPLRERCLWSLLYESAARSAEVLRFDVEDLDLANHRARVTRKGGAHDMIVWKSRTARLLSNYLCGRRDGPVFLTERGAKSDTLLGPGDRDESGRARVSYERAETLFREWSAEILGTAATLHQLRHSALTHDAEDGASAPLLMTKSGHSSLRTLGKYARPVPRRWPPGSSRPTAPAGGGTDTRREGRSLLFKPVAHLRWPLRTSLRCLLFRRVGSCNILDGLGQQPVPGRRGVDVAGPVGKLDEQSRRARRSPEGGRPRFEGGEAIGDLPAEGLGNRCDHRVE
jgi:site-specific recombinase XerD